MAKKKAKRRRVTPLQQALARIARLEEEIVRLDARCDNQIELIEDEADVTDAMIGRRS